MVKYLTENTFDHLVKKHLTINQVVPELEAVYGYSARGRSSNIVWLATQEAVYVAGTPPPFV